MASPSITYGHSLNIGSYKRQSLSTLYWNPLSKLAFSNCRSQIRIWGNKSRLTFNQRKSLVVNENIVPEVPLPPSTPQPSGSGFKSWLLGIMVSIILPFFSHKWGPLWVIKNRIDGAVQMVENVAEAVVKVAGKVDKITEHIADALPEGPLKNMFRMIEQAAETTAVAADALDTAIDNVQKAEAQVESIVGSVVQEKANKISKL